MILAEKLKISPLFSGKIVIYEYLSGKEILPPQQRKVMQESKFSYSPLEKTLEKQLRSMVKKIEVIIFRPYR